MANLFTARLRQIWGAALSAAQPKGTDMPKHQQSALEKLYNPTNLTPQQQNANRIAYYQAMIDNGTQIPVGQLTDADCAFLMAAGEHMQFDPRQFMSGTQAAVNKAGGTDQWDNMHKARFDSAAFIASGAISPAVLALVKGFSECGVPIAAKGWHDITTPAP